MERVENPGSSIAAVQHHYDVGNDFFRLWLDRTLTYSCALWKDGDTLESAQLRKIDFHVNQARAGGAKRVLDVGCGWGSALKRLVEAHNVEQAVGLTLSKNQAEWIASSKHPQIEGRLESWSNYSPEDPFDAIVSIGAFEHFARPDLGEMEKVEAHRTFFQRCHQWLRPGGWMSLQTLIQLNMRPEDLHPVVPETLPELELPSLAGIAEATERIFEIVTLRNDRADYARTIRAWLARLKSNRQAAIHVVGEDVVARYQKWLSFCLISLHVGSMGLMRITLRRIDGRRSSLSSG